jgi:hypothetical protein
LWNIGVVLFTAAIAAFVILISVEEILGGSPLGARYLMLSASIVWMVVSVYLIGQYVMCMFAPFAVRIGVENVELCSATFSLAPRRRFIVFDNKYRNKITFFIYGVTFSDPVDMYIDGKKIASGGIYMLWNYVKKPNETAKRICSLAQAQGFE